MVKNYHFFLLFIIAFLLFSCEKQIEKPEGISVNEISTTSEYFKGVIKLDEKDILGVNSEVTVTLNGDDVKREVKESGATIYGMIYKKDQNSVIYFYKKDEQFYHTNIIKKDFIHWVSTLKRPQINTESGNTSVDFKSPFGTIFIPFESYFDIFLLNTTKVDLKKYGSASLNTYAIGKDLLASVWYSEAIKIRPEILELIEYNQPKSIKTLTLQVFYTSPKNKESADLPNKIFEKLNKLSVKLKSSSQFNSINTAESTSMELPLNSKKISIVDMDNLINPPNTSGGDSGGHNHDFFD